MTRPLPSLLLSLLLLTACGSDHQDATTAAPVEAVSNAESVEQTDVMPTGQLPKSVRPQHYRLDLTVIPDDDQFTGEVEIDVVLLQASDTIWLHGKNLDVNQAQLQTADGESIGANYQQVDEDGLVKLTLAKTVAAQSATLQLRFTAPFGNLYGLYKVVDDELPYVFTQMEPISAREAFPGFDEPAFKTPFDVSVTTKAEYQALSNTRAVQTEDLGNGLKRVRYATTEKLPTYLIAFTVGPVDVVEWEPIAPTAVRDRPLALRGITAKGKGEQMRYALEHTAGLLNALEAYFDTPYPYDKLDIVAAPDFAAGAMENPGLILYRETLLLLGENPSLSQQRAYASVHAHELAHQWFGNLVTMPWWDDIWLNEAFATWMGHKAVHSWNPEYNFDRSLQARALSAMRGDSLLAARQIRQPVNDSDDIENAFDGITYSKGGGVLSMLESYLGENTFRSGIRAHIKRHAHGNATVFDLMDSLTAVAPDKDVKAAFDSFLFQPGVPAIDVAVDCSGEHARIKLSQSRYLPHASKGDSAAQWNVPVCLSYGVDQQTREQCVVLDQAEQEFVLGSGLTCPDWVMPNRRGAGYYRWNLDPQQTVALSNAMDEQLGSKEKMSFADSLQAAYYGGSASAEDVLNALPAFANSTERNVVTALNRPLDDMLDEVLTEANRDQARAWTAEVFGQRLQALRDGHSESAMEGRLLEASLVQLLANTAKQPAIRTELATKAMAMLGIDPAGGGSGELDMEAVSPDLAGTALQVLGEQANDDQFAQMLTHFKASRSARLRGQLLRGMTSNPNPDNLQQLLDLAMGGELRTNELPRVLFGMMAEETNRSFAWQFVSTNIDDVLALLPNDYQGSMPTMGTYFCSTERLNEINALFEPRIDSMQGGPRKLAQAQEWVELCIARKAKHSASANAFFSKLAESQ